MALFRKFFYRKPPDGLLEISERIYVFDCCFAIDVLEYDEYKAYLENVVGQLRDYFPDATFVVFNFRNGGNHSQIGEILSEHDITVMDYPRHYENCPLLTMEMIHHFLKSSESWLSLGQRNVLLLHCERRGWPVLAFILAAFLIYRKQYKGEHKTLNMIYKQTPCELLQLMSPVNPLPSQLRYLQYVSRRNVGSEWPPLVRALTLDCIILRVIPNWDEEIGCCPIIRIYGPDPFMTADKTPKVLFSTPKRSKNVRRYKQADCELVKIDIHCHIQGDVILECITLGHDLDCEEMMFRVMFNTAFIRSNILILNRDEIDTLWNAKNKFSTDFRAEVLFSEMNSSSLEITFDLPVIEDKGGLPIEAFTKIQEIFSNVDCQDPKADSGVNMFQMTASNIRQEDLENVQDGGKENLGTSFSQCARTKILESAKEDNCQTVSGQSARTENLDSIPIEAFSKVREMFNNVGWLDPNTDVALNIFQITASNMLQEKLETILDAGKEKLNSRSEQSAGTGILESVSSESAREKKQETAYLQCARVEKLDTSSPWGAKEGRIFHEPSADFILETPNSEVLDNEAYCSQQTKMEVPSIVSPKSVGELDSFKRESQQLPASLLRPFQPGIVFPGTPLCSLSNPASYSNSLQSSPEPLSKYQSTPSLPGITALLHDGGGLNNKVGAHVVTLSPKSALSASFPHLCKPLPPSFLQITPSSELPCSAPFADGKMNKDLTAASSSSQSPSSGLVLPKALSVLPPKTASQPSIHSSSASEELDSLCKSDSEASLYNKGPLTTVPLLPHSGDSVSSSLRSSFGPPPTPPPFPRAAAYCSAKKLKTPPPLPPFSSSLGLVPLATCQNSSSTPATLQPLLPETASSSCQVPSLLEKQSSAIAIGSHVPTPPPVCSAPDSSASAISLVQLPPFPSGLSSSCETPSPAIEQSTSIPTQSPHPLSGEASSNGLISLIISEKNLELANHLPPSPLNLGSFSSPLEEISKVLPPPPPSPPSLPPPSSSSFRIAMSPISENSTSVSLISGPISSHLLGKISLTVPRPPPLPPLNSRTLSSPAASLLAPIPPPPPSFAPNKSMCEVSEHVQPVPPVPPAPPPSISASAKDGNTSQHRFASCNGNIPPIPAPPLGEKGRLQSRSTSRNQTQTKKTSLKPYHWLKLTRAIQGSLWAEAQKPEEASKTPQFDLSELESLFSATVPNSAHGSTTDKSSRASRNKSDKVNLIDLRRANNCEIMLSKVKVPLPQLMSSVLVLDDSTLDIDQVDNLIKFCPTKEEMELLQNYKGDWENLGRCEQFFLELMKVPRVESKLRVFSFKIQFCSQISDLRKSLNLISSAAEEVRNSVKLKRIMQTILSLGNAMNQGTTRGSAVGFRLDSLLKLTDTRSRNSKMTLMHYLCKVLGEKLPELLDFPKDLESLDGAAKLQLKYLAEEMQAISKGLEKVSQELADSENDGPVSESFCKMLKGFLQFAENEVRTLASLYSGVGKNADSLALYFGEDPARCSFEQVISTLHNFVRMFVRAHDENCKQLDLEKKRAQRDAEKEKGKFIPSEKNNTKMKRSLSTP